MKLERAERLSEIAKEVAKKMNVFATITIVDKNAVTIVYKKMDEAHIASTEISPAKAKTAASFKKETAVLGISPSIDHLRAFDCEKKFCFLGGGVPIFVEDNFIGAIGISGGTVDQDILIAKESIEIFLTELKK